MFIGKRHLAWVIYSRLKAIERQRTKTCKLMKSIGPRTTHSLVDESVRSNVDNVSYWSNVEECCWFTFPHSSTKILSSVLIPFYLKTLEDSYSKRCELFLSLCFREWKSKLPRNNFRYYYIALFDQQSFLVKVF